MATIDAAGRSVRYKRPLPEIEAEIVRRMVLDFAPEVSPRAIAGRPGLARGVEGFFAPSLWATATVPSEGARPEAARDWLGHSNLAATVLYIPASGEQPDEPDLPDLLPEATARAGERRAVIVLRRRPDGRERRTIAGSCNACKNGANRKMITAVDTPGRKVAT